MFDAVTTKCYKYDKIVHDGVVESPNITYTSRAQNEQYTCYHKANPVISWTIDIDNGKQVVTGDDRKGGWSCDQVCTNINKQCDQDSLNALNNNTAAFETAYEAAGFSCSNGGIRTDCEGGSNCVNWGSPYIHNSHIADNLCWGGSVPSVAPCDQSPVDAQHRRLCPCAPAASSDM